MNFQDFRAHSGSFLIAGANLASISIVGVRMIGQKIDGQNIARLNNEMYHTTSFSRSPTGY
jgi:hypothetical protein